MILVKNNKIIPIDTPVEFFKKRQKKDSKYYQKFALRYYLELRWCNGRPDIAYVLYVLRTIRSHGIEIKSHPYKGVYFRDSIYLWGFIYGSCAWCGHEYNMGSLRELTRRFLLKPSNFIDLHEGDPVGENFGTRFNHRTH